MSVAIVDYGSGNLHSAAKAFERAARESGHKQPILVTGDPDAVARAERIVLPGVGAFADCRRGLDAIPGMIDALEQSVRKVYAKVNGCKHKEWCLIGEMHSGIYFDLNGFTLRCR